AAGAARRGGPAGGPRRLRRRPLDGRAARDARGGDGSLDVALPVEQRVAHALLVRLADAARQRPALPREARALVEPRAVAGDVVLGSADLAGRVADGDGARSDVTRDDAPGADDRVVADRGVRQD